MRAVSSTIGPISENAERIVSTDAQLFVLAPKRIPVLPPDNHSPLELPGAPKHAPDVGSHTIQTNIVGRDKLCASAAEPLSFRRARCQIYAAAFLWPK